MREEICEMGAGERLLGGRYAVFEVIADCVETEGKGGGLLEEFGRGGRDFWWC